ncbi:hypothetical protein ABIC09_006474 [Bradyrhizobium sp. S3.12.5]
MRHQLAEPDGKALLFGIVEMSLVTEEDDLVFQQHLIDGTDGLVRRSPDSLMFLISAPNRAARLTMSAGGMTLSMVVVSLMIVSRHCDPLDKAPPCAGRGNDGGDR